MGDRICKLQAASCKLQAAIGDERSGAMTTILAIETSCDETGAAVIRGGRRILANVVASQADLHQRYGGVVPELASRQHITALLPVARTALAEAGAALDDLDAVAVTAGPGLAGSLLVGVNWAKAVAYARELPLVAVNHLEGHLYSNWLLQSGEDVDAPLPAFPLVCLIVSGGHTELVLMAGHGHYRLLGRTTDDAAGEAFDKGARILGLGYPGGPAIQRAAAGGHPERYRLPRAWLGDSSDFSFSGVKTALLRATEKYRLPAPKPARRPTPEEPFPLHEPARFHPSLPVADLAAAYQEAIVDVLVEKTARAARGAGATMVMLAGGVAANALLRERLGQVVDLPVRYPPLALCTDNAAMIGAAAHYRLRAGEQAGWRLDVHPNLALV
ncbi:MAG TPA: tRNA (adenosine(37)-N6)-threonylcarbamoyltransferase complex transferase subunit TsaD [Thermomicrobiales bacterium]|nr:tRNA (adenosine(37)-N6)-threonylcarbamoyltransferase complex transferase subunit TsaD [Thermomicrobiales bacterium]